MNLTPKQELFCVEIIKGKNQSEAYLTAYGANSASAKTVNEKASRLMKNPKIVERLAELRAPAIEAAQLTLSEHLTDLQKLRDMAMNRGQLGSAVSAEVARGKASGLYVEKVKVDVTVDLAEVDTKIAALMLKLGGGGRASRRA